MYRQFVLFHPNFYIKSTTNLLLLFNRNHSVCSIFPLRIRLGRRGIELIATLIKGINAASQKVLLAAFNPAPTAQAQAQFNSTLYPYKAAKRHKTKPEYIKPLKLYSISVPKRLSLTLLALPTAIKPLQLRRSLQLPANSHPSLPTHPNPRYVDTLPP